MGQCRDCDVGSDGDVGSGELPRGRSGFGCYDIAGEDLKVASVGEGGMDARPLLLVSDPVFSLVGTHPIPDGTRCPR